MARSTKTYTVWVDNVDDVLAAHQNDPNVDIAEIWNTLTLVEATELTIAAGVITVVQNYHTVDTAGDAASDDLDTITLGTNIEEGTILVIRPDNDARTIVIKHNTGNILCPGGEDITLKNEEDSAMLMYDETLVKWIVISYTISIISSQFALTAGGGQPTTTNGCADAVKLELGTNDVDIVTLNFDKDNDEYAVWQFPLPDDYDGGTVLYRVYWSHPAAAAFVVYWELSLLMVGDDDAMDQAWGAAISVNDAGGTTNDKYITAWSAAVTPAGSPAAGASGFFRLMRDANHASDTLDVDARVHSIQIEYTRA